MERLLTVENVSYDYTSGEGDVTHALRNVELTLDRGEFLVVIGHNGSGKSTLAKLLNGLLLPTEGTITVAGMDTRDEEKIWDIRQKAGLVFQNPDNQMVTTIVEEDVAFGPENLGLAPEVIRARVDRALGDVGMTEFALAAPHLLSGGQKQRIAIAGILAMEPELLILDESTAMLDPMGRREVLRAVQTLQKERGMAVVWITHFMEEAVAADRILVMNEGKTVMVGTPDEVFSRADELERIGLDVPMSVRIAEILKDRGVVLDPLPLTVEALAEELCRSR